jgi:hypothetical protein
MYFSILFLIFFLITIISYFKREFLFTNLISQLKMYLAKQEHPSTKPGTISVGAIASSSESDEITEVQKVWNINDHVVWLGQPAVIVKIIKSSEGPDKYFIQWNECGFHAIANGNDLTSPSVTAIQLIRFNPDKLLDFAVVNNFYQDPDTVRRIALEQTFKPDLKWYKGKRTEEKFLFPYMKEEFEKILRHRVVGWLDQKANGIFQLTKYTDPLVWHSDSQTYAAAIYLTPNAPAGAGTSFWRDKKYHCRRPPTHPEEYSRFSSDEERNKVMNEVYTEYTITHPDPWELVDRVGGIYNRLVMWNGNLIHSASSYEGFDLPDDKEGRLVQLFFFDVER